MNIKKFKPYFKKKLYPVGSSSRMAARQPVKPSATDDTPPVQAGGVVEPTNNDDILAPHIVAGLIVLA